MDKTTKKVNDIRINYRSRIGRVISYCEKLLKENNLRDLTLTAIGGSIGKLVNLVELLKTIYPGLYQVNRLATISYQSVEAYNNAEGGEKVQLNSKKLFPKLEVKLTLDKPDEETEGYQEKLSEEERTKLLDAHKKSIEKAKEKRKNKPRKFFSPNRGRGYRVRRMRFGSRDSMRKSSVNNRRKSSSSYGRRINNKSVQSRSIGRQNRRGRMRRGSTRRQVAQKR